MAETGFPTLWARREPDRQYARYGYTQISIYRDLSELPVAVFPFSYESRPTRASRTVTINCMKYRVEWLPDLIGPPVHVGDLRMRRLRNPNGTIALYRGYV